MEMENATGGHIAVFSKTFYGTGFCLFGYNGNQGIISVDIDGGGGTDWDLCTSHLGELKEVLWAHAAWARGLGDAEHTVTVTLKNTLHTSATLQKFSFYGMGIEGPSTLEYDGYRGGVKTLVCAATVSPDARDGDCFVLTLDQNVTTLNVPSNAPPGYRCRIRIIQDATTKTVAWAAGWKCASGSIPAVSTGAGDIDAHEFYTEDGTSFWQLAIRQDLLAT